MNKIAKADFNECHNYGLDILRIFCCFGVLIYHVADDTFSVNGLVFTKTMILYFMASFCVPTFFMLSGYFTMAKAQLTKENLEKKVFQLLKKLFGWYVLFIFLHYLDTGEVKEVILEMENGFLSTGLLPVAWFLFTLIIILIFFAYPMYFLLHKYPKLYFLFLFLAVTTLMMAKHSNMILDFMSRPQALWLNIYVLFWGLGGEY